LRADFAGAYQQHVLDVYGFVAYRVRSRADAEDLTQATFERALAAWRQYDPDRASMRTWLLAIARNVVADHHRRGPGRAEEPVDALTVGRDALVEPEEPRFGLDPRLAAGLERLGRRDREVVALRFGGDLAGPEIAELTGLTLANVQQILSRSLRRLRAELEGAEPVAELAEPVAGRAEPVAGRAEPLSGRAGPVAGRAEPVAGLTAGGSRRPRRSRYGASGPLPAAPSAATASRALPESA
jgi:RNA polymerase sigma-70 factor, ECF subfamily